VRLDVELQPVVKLEVLKRVDRLKRGLVDYSDGLINEFIGVNGFDFWCPQVS
jgi:hypothetical protein